MFVGDQCRKAEKLMGLGSANRFDSNKSIYALEIYFYVDKTSRFSGSIAWINSSTSSASN